METLEQLLSREGEYPKAHLLMGRMLLDGNDDRGLKHLLLAVEQDLELTEEAGRAGYVYLMRRGREKEAQAFLGQGAGSIREPATHAGLAHRLMSTRRLGRVRAEASTLILAQFQLLRVWNSLRLTFGVVFRQAITLLQLAGENVGVAFHLVDLVVRELAPLRLDLALELLEITACNVFVHASLRCHLVRVACVRRAP